MSEYRPPREELSDGYQILTNSARDPPPEMSRPDGGLAAKTAAGKARTKKTPAQPADLSAAVVFRFLRRSMKTLGTLAATAVSALNHALDVYVNMLAAILRANPRPAVLVKALRKLLYWRSSHVGPTPLYVPAGLKAEAGPDTVDRSGRPLPWRWERSLSRDLLGRYGLIAIGTAVAVAGLAYKMPDQRGQEFQTTPFDSNPSPTQTGQVNNNPPPSQTSPDKSSTFQKLPMSNSHMFEVDTPVNNNPLPARTGSVNNNRLPTQTTSVNNNPPPKGPSP